MPDIFRPAEPLPCPDCEELGTVFYDHCVVGWLCACCYARVQRACEGIAAYASTHDHLPTGDELRQMAARHDAAMGPKEERV